MTESDDQNALVAEYAMGLLGPTEQAALEARLAADPALRAEVADWQERLAAMAVEEVDEVHPPARIKTSLDVRLFAEQPPRLGFWARFGMGSLAGVAASLAVLIALMIWLPRTQQMAPDLVADLSAEGSALRVEAKLNAPDDVLSLVTLAGVAPDGRVLEMWVIFEGEPPISLGVMSGGSETLMVPDALAARMAGGALLAVTDEPPGGAPDGIPTGQIHASGELRPL